MTEAEQRTAVVAEARSFIGTRYHHMGRIKVARDPHGAITDCGGVDCATLLAEVFARAGAILPVRIAHYPPDWHLHRGAERYLSQLESVAHPVEEAAVRPGDIVLYRYGRAWSHGAIVVDPGWPAIVHAFWTTGCVHPDRGDGGELADRPRRFFSVW